MTLPPILPRAIRLAEGCDAVVAGDALVVREANSDILLADVQFALRDKIKAPIAKNFAAAH